MLLINKILFHGLITFKKYKSLVPFLISFFLFNMQKYQLQVLFISYVHHPSYVHMWVISFYAFLCLISFIIEMKFFHNSFSPALLCSDLLCSFHVAQLGVQVQRHSKYNGVQALVKSGLPSLSQGEVDDRIGNGSSPLNMEEIFEEWFKFEPQKGNIHSHLSKLTDIQLKGVCLPVWNSLYTV